MLDGEEAGIKSATIHIEGDNAYGFLESPKTASTGWCASRRSTPHGRRHTSFASVEVMPEIEKDVFR